MEHSSRTVICCASSSDAQHTSAVLQDERCPVHREVLLSQKSRFGGTKILNACCPYCTAEYLVSRGDAFSADQVVTEARKLEELAKHYARLCEKLNDESTDIGNLGDEIIRIKRKLDQGSAPQKAVDMRRVHIIADDAIWKMASLLEKDKKEAESKQLYATEQIRSLRENLTEIKGTLVAFDGRSVEAQRLAERALQDTVKDMGLLASQLEQQDIRFGNDIEEIKEELELAHEDLVSVKRAVRDVSLTLSETTDKSIKQLIRQFWSLQDRMVDVERRVGLVEGQVATNHEELQQHSERLDRLERQLQMQELHAVPVMAEATVMGVVGVNPDRSAAHAAVVEPTSRGGSVAPSATSACSSQQVTIDEHQSFASSSGDGFPHNQNDSPYQSRECSSRTQGPVAVAIASMDSDGDCLSEQAVWRDQIDPESHRQSMTGEARRTQHPEQTASDPDIREMIASAYGINNLQNGEDPAAFLERQRAAFERFEAATAGHTSRLEPSFETTPVRCPEADVSRNGKGLSGQSFPISVDEFIEDNSDHVGAACFSRGDNHHDGNQMSAEEASATFLERQIAAFEQFEAGTTCVEPSFETASDQSQTSQKDASSQSFPESVDDFIPDRYDHDSRLSFGELGAVCSPSEEQCRDETPDINDIIASAHDTTNSASFLERQRAALERYERATARHAGRVEPTQDEIQARARDPIVPTKPAPSAQEVVSAPTTKPKPPVAPTQVKGTVRSRGNSEIVTQLLLKIRRLHRLMTVEIEAEWVTYGRKRGTTRAANSAAGIMASINQFSALYAADANVRDEEDLQECELAVIVATMAKFPTKVAEIQFHGICALRYLALNKFNRPRIEHVSGIKAIMEAMNRSASNRDILRTGAYAIFDLSWNNAHNAQVIATLGGIELMLSTLKRLSGDHDALKAGCLALGALAQNNKALSNKIGSKRGIDLILRTLKQNRSQSVVPCACFALEALTGVSSANRARIDEVGAVAFVRRAFVRLPSNQRTATENLLESLRSRYLFVHPHV